MLPEVLGYSNLKDMIEPIRSGKYDASKMYKVPPLVFQLAAEGDMVCQDIFINIGRTMGQMAAAVIKK